MGGAVEKSMELVLNFSRTAAVACSEIFEEDGAFMASELNSYSMRTNAEVGDFASWGRRTRQKVCLYREFRFKGAVSSEFHQSFVSMIKVKQTVMDNFGVVTIVIWGKRKTVAAMQISFMQKRRWFAGHYTLSAQIRGRIVQRIFKSLVDYTDTIVLWWSGG